MRSIALGVVAALACGSATRLPVGRGEVTPGRVATGRTGPTGEMGAARWVEPTPAGMLFLAYQASGTREGRPAAVSRYLVNFGAETDGATVVESEECTGIATREAPGVFLPAIDAGEMVIAGGVADFRCAVEGGVYRCDLPGDEPFFEDGALLALRVGGGRDFYPMDLGAIAPPSAPVPQVDLARIARGEALRVTWEPTGEHTPMTCLQMETVAAEGFVNGFVQCDVMDALGEAVVPPEVAAVLDRDAPVARAALFRVEGAEAESGVSYAQAYFGRGRFVELRR